MLLCKFPQQRDFVYCICAVKQKLRMEQQTEILAMASAQRRPHVIVLPFPADGHINPLMRLSKILTKMGFSITFVNTQGNHERLLDTAKQSGISVDQDPSFKLVGLAGFSHEETKKLAGMKGAELMLASVDSLRKPFENLVEQELGKNPCSVACIISDFFVYWSSQVADRFGLDMAIFFPSNAITHLVLQSLEELRAQGLVPIKDPSASSTIPIAFSSDLILMQNEIPMIMHEDCLFVEYFCKCKARARDWNLVNSFEELEPKAVEAMRKMLPNYLPVSPMHHYAGCNEMQGKNEIGLTVEDRSCMDWLDKRAEGSVLYVSFGSLSVLGKEQLRNIAKGVMDSKVPFLWIQRPTLTGEEEDVGWIFEGLNEEEGIVVKWAPQIEVLQHRSVGGFLSHCGWNSTLESACAGVPLLAWPLLGEQNLNCKLVVEEWKIGLDFRGAIRDEGGLVSAQDVKSGVLRLMECEEGRECLKRVREIREMGIAAALPSGSSSINLQLFADAFIMK